MPPSMIQDEALLSELMREHQTDFTHYAWIVIRRMGALDIGSNLVEDAIQETFLQAWRCPKRLETAEDAQQWIYSALDLKLRELLRSERRWANRQLKLQLESDPEVQPIPEEWLDLYAAMESLPEEDAHLLYLHFWMGYSYRELSEMFGCTVTNISTKMHRIRKKLEKYLKKKKKFKNNV